MAIFETVPRATGSYMYMRRPSNLRKSRHHRFFINNLHTFELLDAVCSQPLRVTTKQKAQNRLMYLWGKIFNWNEQDF
jgi:hypothetical protein